MILLGVLLFLLATCLFCLAPHMPRRSLGTLADTTMYAHRGLWQPGIPENSLPAFARAADMGFGIELDVQMTKDHVLVVFHDAALDRMCGKPALLTDLTYAELQKFRLDHTACRIPTLDEVLSVVDSRVPMIIEIKTCSEIREVCERLAGALACYQGAFCIESFDPRAVRWFRRNHPEIIRGQLAYGLSGGKYPHTTLNVLLASLLQNVMGRPDFIAFDHDTDHSIPFRIIRRLFRPWLVAWTIQTPEASRHCLTSYDLQIFERFIPDHTK